MRAGRTLRRLVFDRIEAAVPALAGQVFDKAVENTTYPYVTLGPSYGRHASTACIKARSITLQVDLWHSAANKGVCEDLVDDIAAALQDWSDEASLTMHPVEVTMARVMDDPSGNVHGIIQIDVLVEADPST